MFDYRLEEAMFAKVLKYQPLKTYIEQLGYNCKLLFGRLGSVHCPQTSRKGFADVRNSQAKILLNICDNSPYSRPSSRGLPLPFT